MMNENAGRPAAFLLKREDAKKDKGIAVLGSALEEAGAAASQEGESEHDGEKSQEASGDKTRPRKERVIDSAKRTADRAHIEVSQHVKGDATLEATRHSSITFDMDIYMTLTDLKRMKKLSIHKYCNEAIRERLKKDFTADLDRNAKLIKE